MPGPMSHNAPSVIRRPIAWATDEIEGNLIEFDVRWFKRLRKPGIYFINGWIQPLYVGMATNLLARISSPEHDAVVNSLKEQVSQILLVPAKSEAHARDMETAYIRALQPKYNVRGKYSKFQLIRIFEQDFKEALLNRLG